MPVCSNIVSPLSNIYHLIVTFPKQYGFSHITSITVPTDKYIAGICDYAIKQSVASGRMSVSIIAKRGLSNGINVDVRNQSNYVVHSVDNHVLLVSIASRSSILITDALVLVITWKKTFNIKRAAMQSNLKAPLVTLILRDGNVPIFVEHKRRM